MAKGKRGKQPVHSMTGFGRADLERGGRTLSAEIRTVNHRYLEVSARFPRGFQFLEGKVRAYLQERLARGKVNLTLAWKGDGEGGRLNWDEELASRYFALLQEVRTRFDFREPITLGHLLGHPDILNSREPELGEKEAWEMLRTVLASALDDLISMRVTEGEALVRDLRARVASIREGVKAVETRSPERAREAKVRLRERVADLLEGEAEVDEDRLLLEAAFQAERMDCTEECVRLGSHLDQFLGLLDTGGAVGRKLNFLLQEMNRETNTIGSKANDAAISRTVIQLKEEIEILREQIQNLE